MKMKIYDLIKITLEDYPETRNSDKKLIWRVWCKLGYIDTGYALYEEDFMRSPSTETIRRCRQKIQELNPELQATRRIRGLRKSVELQRGTHVFREKVIEQTRFI